MECSATFASQGASAAGPQAVGAVVRLLRRVCGGLERVLLVIAEASSLPLPSRVLAAEPTRGYSGEHHMYASKLFLQSPDLQ